MYARVCVERGWGVGRVCVCTQLVFVRSLWVFGDTLVLFLEGKQLTENLDEKEFTVLSSIYGLGEEIK